MSSVPPQLSLVLYQQVLVCHSVGYRKNSLTSEFECWVIVKLWNKECRPRGGGGTLCLLCWAWKTPKPFVNCSEISSSRHNHTCLNSALFSPSQKVNLLCNGMFWLTKISISYQNNCFWISNVSCRNESESSSWETFPEDGVVDVIIFNARSLCVSMVWGWRDYR